MTKIPTLTIEYSGTAKNHSESSRQAASHTQARAGCRSWYKFVCCPSRCIPILTNESSGPAKNHGGGLRARCTVHCGKQNRRPVLAAKLEIFGFLPFPMHTMPMNPGNLLLVTINGAVSVNLRPAWPPFLTILAAFRFVPFPGSRSIPLPGGCASDTLPEPRGQRRPSPSLQLRGRRGRGTHRTPRQQRQWWCSRRRVQQSGHL